MLNSLCCERRELMTNGLKIRPLLLQLENFALPPSLPPPLHMSIFSLIWLTGHTPNDQCVCVYGVWVCMSAVQLQVDQADWLQPLVKTKQSLKHKNGCKVSTLEIGPLKKRVFLAEQMFASLQLQFKWLLGGNLKQNPKLFVENPQIRQHQGSATLYSHGQLALQRVNRTTACRQ